MARNRGVAHRQVDDQTIIVVPKTGEVMVLNTTGSVVWELSDGRHDAEEVAAELAARFEVSMEDARSDVRGIYRDLISAGVAHAEP